MNLVSALAAILAAALAGCAALQAGPAGPAGQIRTTTTATPAGFHLAADRGKAVYIEFLDSPTLTAALRRELAAAGYQLAASRELASVTYGIDGAFQALRPATGRTAEVRAGDYAEQPGRLATTTGRGPSVMLSLNPVAMLLGTVLSNAGDRTGARDEINATTVGDPDGKCLAKCDGWMYQQRAVVRIVRTEGRSTATAIAISTLEAAELQPASLFTASKAELSKTTGLQLNMKPVL